MPYANVHTCIREETSEVVQQAVYSKLEEDGSVFDQPSPERANDKKLLENQALSSTAPIRVSQEIHSSAASK